MSELNTPNSPVDIYCLADITQQRVIKITINSKIVIIVALETTLLHMLQCCHEIRCKRRYKNSL